MHLNCCERVSHRVPRKGWIPVSLLFISIIALTLSSGKIELGAAGLGSSGTSIYDEILSAMRIHFAVLLSIQVALLLFFLSRRQKHNSPELRNIAIATQVVFLCTWLAYAIFFGLSHAPASEPLVPMLLIPLALSVVAGIGTYLSAGNLRNDMRSFLRLPRKHPSALAVFAIAIVVYFGFLSCSLSEWDSINFAQALDRYDLQAHQPHAPGYSLYVFLGKLASVATGSKLLGLTSVSAISGALGLLPTYVIARKMYDGETAAVTCVALMSTRMWWLSSEKAVTHMLAAFLITLAVSLLYLGLKGKRTLLLISWPVAGIAVGARPSIFPFLALWVYAAFQEKELKRLLMYLTLFISSVLSWLTPIILLTGWHRFWELIWVQYEYIATNEFVGASFGLGPGIRFLFMLIGFTSCGLGTPIQLMYPESGGMTIYQIPSLLILCVIAALTAFALSKIRQTWNVKKTFVFLWTIPYSLFVYLVSNPSYPRYFLPILPPIMIALVSTAWTAGRSLRYSTGKAKMKGKLLAGLVLALIVLNFINSTGLAVQIHTTEVPMVRLTRHVRNHYNRDTPVIVFHEYKAFQYFLPGYKYLSAQYDRNEILQIFESLSKKNQTVLITETSIRYMLSATIARLGLEKVEVARFEMDPHVETEQHTIILYRLQSTKIISSQQFQDHSCVTVSRLALPEYCLS